LRVEIEVDGKAALRRRADDEIRLSVDVLLADESRRPRASIGEEI